MRRGDIRVWVSPEAVAGRRAPAGRRTFTDAAIAAALTVRAVYHLALRQAEGLIRSIFALLGLALPMPDHTTLSRRGRTLRLDRGADAGRGRQARHVAQQGRRAWERATGYGCRNAAEWSHSRWKRVLGGALRPRSMEARRAEAAIAAGALNRMAELGLPRAVRGA